MTMKHDPDCAHMKFGSMPHDSGPCRRADGTLCEPQMPYKGEINQPCSACSAGDVNCEFHDHEYVKPENRTAQPSAPSPVEATRPVALDWIHLERNGIDNFHVMLDGVVVGTWSGTNAEFVRKVIATQMEKFADVCASPSSAPSRERTLNDYAAEVHIANDKWWRDVRTGEPIKRNFGELIALCHSELSEALEGDRKDLMDDKLPHRKMVEVELADCVIRILDICAGLGFDLEGAYREKMAFNAVRADHKAENRIKPGGKAY